MNLDKIWLLWVLLVAIWNFGWPDVPAIADVIVAIILSIFVNIGMWFERFVIIVTSLHRDFLPSSWVMFSPSFVDIGIFLGTIGFFFVLFLLYARTFPVIPTAEVKTILKSSGENYKKLRDGNHE